MAAHRGDDEDARPRLADPLDDRPYHPVDPVDAAASDGQTDPCPRLDRHHDRVERGPDGIADVGDLSGIEPQPNQSPLWQRPSRELGKGRPTRRGWSRRLCGGRQDWRVAQTVIAVSRVPAAACAVVGGHIVIALKPPSTRTIAPVTNPDARPDASQIAAPMSSSASPSRRVLDDRPDALLREEPSILLGREESRRDRVDANSMWGELKC